MARYLTELIGTFFLVFTIALTVTQGVAEAPLAIGAVLMVMVYMGGHISGAHYNPAVTVAVWLRGAFPRSQILPYVAAQLVGAALASFVAAHLTGQSLVPAPGTGVSAGTALIAEVLFTFALVLVILNVATSRHTQGNSYYGLAIGFTVMGGAYAVGGISEAVFNPAVGTGPIVIGLLAGGSAAHLWLYWVGPLLGGLLAVLAFRIQEGEEPAPAP